VAERINALTLKVSGMEPPSPMVRIHPVLKEAMAERFKVAFF
jgi:hypothetical protein